MIAALRQIGLNAVLSVGTEFGVVVLERLATSALVLVTPHVHGGGRDDFRLLLREEDGNYVTVREDASAQRLPATCPARHINVDSTFCLGWNEEDPSVVKDVACAHGWWEALLIFLRYQKYAEWRRAWPEGRERAHGADAAKYQMYAEWLASLFGPKLLSDLRADRLTIRRVGRSTRLEQHGRRLFALPDGGQSVVNIRQPCPCSTSTKRLVLKACGVHALAARLLIVALSGQRQFEVEFNEAFARSRKCCGTIDRCPMAAIASPPGPTPMQDVEMALSTTTANGRG